MFVKKVEECDKINITFNEFGKAILNRVLIVSNTNTPGKINTITVQEELSYDDVFKLYKENGFYDDNEPVQLFFDKMNINAKRALLEFRTDPLYYQTIDVKNSLNTLTTVRNKYPTQGVVILEEIMKEYDEKYPEFKSIIDNDIKLKIAIMNKNIDVCDGDNTKSIFTDIIHTVEIDSMIKEINNEIVLRFAKLIKEKESV